MIGIEHIASFFGPRRVQVKDLPERAGLSDEERTLLDNLGIDSVVADDGYEAFDLALAASRKLLADNALDPREIDLLILLEGRAPAQLMASSAARLQAAIGATGALAFSLGDLGCVSVSAALQVAQNLLAADLAKRRVLIAYGSRPATPHRFRFPVTVLGDGGFALTVARTERNQILALEVQVNGTYWDLFSVDVRDRPPAEWRESCRNLQTYSFELAIESRNRFERLNRAVLAAAALAQGEVRHFLMQNISVGAFGFYENFLGLEFADGCFENLSRYGHLGPMDVILNLERGLASGAFRPGDPVLVMNNSPVAAWSSMLLRI